MLELKFTKKEKRIHRFLINLRDISQFQLKSDHSRLILCPCGARFKILTRESFIYSSLGIVVRTIIFIPFARLIIDRFSTRVVRRTRRNKFPPLKFETRSRESGTIVSIGRTPLVFLSADSSRVRVGFSSTDSPRSPPRPSFSARLDDPRPPNRNFRL